jgi:DNA-binding MarR family transcriptional regulator
MAKNRLGALALFSIALAALLAPAFAQEPTKADFATCTQAEAPIDKAAFIESLFEKNSLSFSDFSGNGLVTEVYAVRRETCPGGDVVNAYFRQGYRGIPIQNYEGMAHFRDGRLEGNCLLVSSNELGGGACDGTKYFDFSSIRAQASIPEQQARIRATSAASEFGEALDVAGMDLVLAYWYVPESDSFKLAYVFGRNASLEFRPRMIDAFVVIDATDGSVLFSDSGIRTMVPERPALPQPALEQSQDANIEPLTAPAMYVGAQQKSGAEADGSGKRETLPWALDLAGIATVAFGVIVALVLAAGAIAIMLKPQDLTVHRALSNEVRAELLSELSDTEKILTDLSEKVGRSKATTLEHLDKLVEAGLIERVETPGKKFVFYRITRSGKEALRGKTAA